MSTAFATAVVLARTGEAAKSGPIGLAVILLLAIACYFLFKSMSKHMRRVREEFPQDPPPPAATPSAEPTAELPADPPAIPSASTTAAAPSTAAEPAADRTDD